MMLFSEGPTGKTELQPWEEKALPWIIVCMLTLVLSLWAFEAFAQTGVVDTKAQLTTDITTNWPDNTSGAITPLAARQTLLNAVVSYQQAPRVNAQTGTTYTIVVDDYGKLVTFSNVGATAITLPQATGNFATFNFFTCNKNSGLVTITPTTSTINGAASLAIANTQCSFIVSDGTNYQATPVNLTGMSNGTGTTCSVSGANGSCSLTAARLTNPTIQTLTSGSGTYTTPANVLWIEGVMIGGGGGGGSSGAGGGDGGAGGNTCWNTTGAACTTPVYQAGGGTGGKGSAAATGGAGLGGTIAGSATCNFGTAGGDGISTSTVGAGTGNWPGGGGGNSSRGGAGRGIANSPGEAGKTNTGGGGGGGGNATTGALSGGGGAGATCNFIINAPAATYTYAVGAAGTGGTGGAAQTGGAGGSGVIYVIEHYGS